MTTVVLAIVNLKGGSGKTTASAHIAQALHDRGLRVLAVDADPQLSLDTWSQVAELPFPCVAKASARLHREIPGFAGDRFDVVVVDTPGTEHGKAITLSAVRAATHVLVPSAPTGVEYRRLIDVKALLEEAVDLDAEFDQGVLLTRTVTGAASTAAYRAQMTTDGWRVLRAHVARLERYAQCFGEQVVGARNSGYGDAVAELLGLEN